MLSPTWPTSHPSPLMFLFNTPLPLVASSLIHSPNFFHSFLGTREKEDGRVVRSTGSCVIDLGWGGPLGSQEGARGAPARQGAPSPGRLLPTAPPGGRWGPAGGGSWPVAVIPSAEPPSLAGPGQGSCDDIIVQSSAFLWASDAAQPQGPQETAHPAAASVSHLQDPFCRLSPQSPSGTSLRIHAPGPHMLPVHGGSRCSLPPSRPFSPSPWQESRGVSGMRG